jgi:hypothetical protein
LGYLISTTTEIKPFSKNIPMKKLLLTAFAAAIMLQVNGQTYTPVTVTGFSADVIANGSGSATSSTSVDFDGSGYNLVAQNFVSPTNQTPAAFLPTNGIITSAATTGLTYQLAPYTSNNSLRITGTGTGSGTLTFATPISASKIYLLGTSVYLSTFTATVNFTDGTNQPFTNLTMERWGATGVGTVAKQTIGKVVRATSILSNPAPAPSLYQIMLTPSAVNANKLIRSITFNKTSSGSGEILHILGISVQAFAPLALGDDIVGLDVVVCPNPANGLFHISLPKGKAYEITVTDLTGKVILTQNVSEAKSQVNLTKAAKGIYLLKIAGEGKTGTRKIVVE